MPATHLTIVATIPLPEGANARAQGAIWHELDDAITALTEAVGKHGGDVKTDSVTRKGPRSPAPPPSASTAPTADLATVAEIGTAVAGAAAHPRRHADDRAGSTRDAA